MSDASDTLKAKYHCSDHGKFVIDFGVRTRLVRVPTTHPCPICRAESPIANSDSWCSPPEVTEPLAEFFGGPVDVDPCSNARSIVQARMSLHSGGLTLPWRLARPVNRSCYENFPFSRPIPWTAKLLAELKSGNVREHVRLSQMDTSTKWWADMCLLPRRNPRILALKRIAFLDPFADEAGMKRESSRFPPALTYFGPRPEKFTRAFAHLTRWTAWGRS